MERVLERCNGRYKEEKTGESVASELEKDFNPGGSSEKLWHASHLKEQLGSNGNWPAR